MRGVRTVFLGPQRFEPQLRTVLDSLDVRGPVAVITAGWQEREDEVDELGEHLECDTRPLELWRRYEELLQQDLALAAALHNRQAQLRELQGLYSLRLPYALSPARELLKRSGQGAAVDEHVREALRLVRLVDRQHLRRVRGVHEAFEDEWRPDQRPAVAQQREQLARLLESVGALLVAGGHVAVLLNRLRLFNLDPLLPNCPVIAWSAGAMALSERVVLFHDKPPQGPGDAEILDVGLGWAGKVVPLPHADKRLNLHDPVRVALFSRRFSPAACVVLDQGARIDWDGRVWRGGVGTRRLSRTGAVRRLAVA